MGHGGPNVCVVIAALNAEACIGRAVASALAQPEASEVVVVDDASSDATAAAARACDDGSGRLCVISLDRNLGPAGARNVALEHSRSPYFCILDADDYFLPGRLAKLLAADRTGWDIVADDIVIVPEQLADVEISIEREAGAAEEGSTPLDLARFVLGNISRPHRPRGEMGFLKPIISRAFLHEKAIRYDPRLRLGEDYALYVRALAAGARFRLVGACGYVAVERQGSISSRHSAADLAALAGFDAECLAAEKTLTPDERAALEAHRAATSRKADYHAVLERKWKLGAWPALRSLPGIPRSLPYIAAETIRARWKRALAMLGYRDTRQIRLLIGMPGTRLSVTPWPRNGVARAYASHGAP